MPVFAGRACRNRVRTPTPPADAPMPITRTNFVETGAGRAVDVRLVTPRLIFTKYSWRQHGAWLQSEPRTGHRAFLYSSLAVLATRNWSLTRHFLHRQKNQPLEFRRAFDPTGIERKNFAPAIGKLDANFV